MNNNTYTTCNTGCKTPTNNTSTIRLSGIESNILSVKNDIRLIYGRLSNLADTNVVHTINDEAINGVKTILGHLFSFSPIKYKADISNDVDFDDRSLIDKGYLVSQLSNFEHLLPTGTTAQYIRGNKTLATLDKAAVGLSLVPNVDATNPANIIQSGVYRFVSDIEKSTWNGKQDLLGYTPVPNTTTINSKVLNANIVLNKSDFSDLNNLDNTSDINKPISTAQQTALNTKIDLSQKAIPNGVATLDITGKVPASQLPVGSQVYKGTWNAATNTPTLADGSGTTGDTYRVAVEGTRNLGSGSVDFIAGDDVIYNGTVWQRNPSVQNINTVNGRKGDVVLTKTDVGLSNVPNVDSTQRSNHIGTQVSSTISDFQTSVTANTDVQNSISHAANTSNPHGVTKTQVGLSNVPNLDTTNPVNITQSSGFRFVTDSEKASWTGKQDLLGYTPVANTRTINSKPLTSDIVLNKTDIGLSNVPNVDATNPANITSSSSFRFTTDTEKTTWNTVTSKLDAVKQSVTTTVAGLRALSNVQSDVPYQTTDLGGGMWYYDASDSTSSDNGATVIVNGTKRIKRVYSGGADPRWWGAVPDGVTDCKPALQAMATAGIPHISFTSVPGAAGYYFASNVTFNSLVTIDGDRFGNPILTDINDGSDLFTFNARNTINNLFISGKGGKKNFLAVHCKAPRFSLDNVRVEFFGTGFFFDNTWVGSIQRCFASNGNLGWKAIQLNGVDVKIDIEICTKGFEVTSCTGLGFQDCIVEGGDAVSPVPCTIDNSLNIHGGLYFEGGPDFPSSHLAIGTTSHCNGIDLNITAVGAAAGIHPITLDDVSTITLTGYVGSGTNSRRAVKTSSKTTGFKNYLEHSGASGSIYTDVSGKLGRRLNYFPNPKFDTWLNGWDSILNFGLASTITKENTIVRKVGGNAIKVTPTTSGTTGYSIIQFALASPLIEKLRGRTITMMAWVYVPNITEFGAPPYSGVSNNAYCYISSYNGTSAVNGTAPASMNYLKGDWNLMTSTVTVQSDATSLSAVFTYLGAGYTNTGNEYIVIGECYFVDGDADENVFLNSRLLDAPVAMSHNGGQLTMSRSAFPTSPLMYFNVGDRCYNSAPTATSNIGWVCTTAGQGGTAVWTQFGSVGVTNPISNSTALQTSSNFNIDGVGKATGGSFQIWETAATGRRGVLSIDTTNSFVQLQATNNSLPVGIRFIVGNTPIITMNTSNQVLLNGTGGTNHVLKQSTASGVLTSGQVADSELSFTDITTNNVNSTNHGFAPKTPNDATKFLNGLGAWSTPLVSGTGLTLSGTTISNNLSTGVSGNQSLIGSTSTDGVLTIAGSNAATNTSTAAAIKLNVGNSAATNALTALNSGFVGIGTTNPLELLQVGTANETATARKTLLFGVGGYGAAGNFSTASNGDKIIFYNGVDFDGRFGVSSVGDVWLKSLSTNTASQTFGSINFLTGQGAGAVPVNRLSISGTGGIGIGTTAPAATSALDIRSTTRGLLLPTMSYTQMSAISSPADGLLVVVTDYNNTVYKYSTTRTRWEAISIIYATTTNRTGFANKYTGLVVYDTDLNKEFIWNGTTWIDLSAIADSDLSFSDITTNNVSTTKHGFAPKAPNDSTKYLDGTGVWSSPVASASAVKVLPDANYTILSTDGTLILTEPTSARTLTLPAASTMTNKMINISCRSLTTGRWLLSGSFVQKGTTGSDPIAEDFVNSGLQTGVNYTLVSDGIKWYDINS